MGGDGKVRVGQMRQRKAETGGSFIWTGPDKKIKNLTFRVQLSPYIEGKKLQVGLFKRPAILA